VNADQHPTRASIRSTTPPVVIASRAARVGMRGLVVVIGLLLAGVIVAPIALSSQDIVAWAGAPHGLGLTRPWDLLTFLALDAAAAVCVGMVVVAAWRGEPAGAFGLLVWAFAAGSAYANYRHGTRPGAPGDAWWFFPAMSVAGPALLEVTVRRIRRWVQTSAGRYERPLPHFRLARWVIALPETWRAWRLAVTEGYWRPEDAILAARLVRDTRNDHSTTPDRWPTADDTHPLSPATQPDSLPPSPAAVLSALSPLSAAMVTPDTVTVAAPNGRVLSPDTPGDTLGDSTRDGQQATADATQGPTPDGEIATPDGDSAIGDSVVRARRQRRGTRRPAAPGDATARMDAAYGDGTDPATGRPWTSRPLATAAHVHHGTAARHLRKLRAGQAEPPPAPTAATPIDDGDHGDGSGDGDDVHQGQAAPPDGVLSRPALPVPDSDGVAWLVEAAT
jgi:hypothetical protein